MYLRLALCFLSALSFSSAHALSAKDLVGKKLICDFESPVFGVMAGELEFTGLQSDTRIGIGVKIPHFFDLQGTAATATDTIVLDGINKLDPDGDGAISVLSASQKNKKWHLNGNTFLRDSKTGLNDSIGAAKTTCVEK